MGSVPVGSLNEMTVVAMHASKKVFEMLLNNQSRKCIREGQAFLDILKGVFELK
jgi:hypothetical protein